MLRTPYWPHRSVHRAGLASVLCNKYLSLSYKLYTLVFTLPLRSPGEGWAAPREPCAAASLQNPPPGLAPSLPHVPFTDQRDMHRLPSCSHKDANIPKPFHEKQKENRERPPATALRTHHGQSCFPGTTGPKCLEMEWFQNIENATKHTKLKK